MITPHTQEKLCRSIFGTVQPANEQQANRWLTSRGWKRLGNTEDNRCHWLSDEDDLVVSGWEWSDGYRFAFGHASEHLPWILVAILSHRFGHSLRGEALLGEAKRMASQLGYAPVEEQQEKAA